MNLYLSLNIHYKVCCLQTMQCVLYDIPLLLEFIKKNSYNYKIIFWKKPLKFIRDRIYDFKLKHSDY